ncbi:hypothetical protein JZ751_003289 [Albula glossodonta]|uniref:Uncharacterized protein n=1 Tax=Albula glossodonta TaxID=121402 RepID=A0A8T2N9I2_9TELE|nr:hypothetical protein JZ751_003289 [Albula glossodonta]
MKASETLRVSVSSGSDPLHMGNCSFSSDVKLEKGRFCRFLDCFVYTSFTGGAVHRMDGELVACDKQENGMSSPLQWFPVSDSFENYVLYAFELSGSVRGNRTAWGLVGLWEGHCTVAHTKGLGTAKWNSRVLVSCFGLCRKTAGSHYVG